MVVRRVLWHVVRTGQRHDAATVAAALGARRADAWRSTIRQCVSLGILAVDHAAGGALKRTPESASVIRGERQVTLRRWADPRAPKARPRPRAPSAGDGSGTAALFERLRAWRADIAKRTGMPAFVVFHDSTLLDIAHRRPASRWALRRIKGVGDVKLARYGREVLRLVAPAG